LNWYSVSGSRFSTIADVCIDEIAQPDAKLSLEKNTAYLSTFAFETSGASHS
jgi:hypothetical protein